MSHPIRVLLCLSLLVAVGGCNKRNSSEVKTAIAAARSAEAAKDRDAMLRALESIPADIRTEEEVSAVGRLTKAKAASAAAANAESAGDRAAFQAALESIPVNFRTPQESQKIVQLSSIAKVSDELGHAKKEGNRAGVKKAVDAIKRLRLPVTADEDNDYTLAISGIALESELELAKQKSDVDGLFLALTKLERTSFLSPDETAMLVKCRQTLQEMQTLRGHLAKHDHEAVVQSADIILSSFPENVEARKAFSESGLIFTYLEAASQAVSGMFGSNKSENMVTAVKAADNSSDKISKLGEADRYLAEALKLDPQYSHSLAMRAAVNATQNVLGGLVAEKVVKNAVTVMSSAEELAVKVFNDVNESTQNSIKYSSRYSPAQGYWDIYGSRYRSKVDEFATLAKTSLGNQSEQITMLKALRNSENADLIDQSIRIIENADAVITGLVMPKGTWSEYSNAITRSQALMNDVTGKYLSASTGYQPVVTRGMQTMVTIFTIQYFRDAERTKPILQKRKELLVQKI